jgi:hypothetical protein
MAKRNPLLIALGIALLAVAGLLGLKMWLEDNMRGRFERFLAGLPAPLTASAEKIDVSYLNKSLTLTNLKLTQAGEAGTVVCAVSRVEADGVNLDAFEPGAGVARLVKSLKISGVTYAGPTHEGSAERYVYEDISGDYGQIRQQLSQTFSLLMEAGSLKDDPKSLQRFAGSLSNILQAAETLTIGKAQSINVVSTGFLGDKKMTFTVASTDAGRNSMREVGPMTISKLGASFDGKRIISLESLSCEGVSLPSFVDFFKVMGERDLDIDGKETLNLLAATLKDQVFALRGLRAKNLVVNVPDEENRVLFSLADMGLNYAAEAAHAVDFTYGGLAVDTAVIEDLPDTARALLPAVLSFSGGFNAQATPREPGAYDLDCRDASIKEPALGGFSLSFAVNAVNPTSLLNEGRDRSRWKSLSLSLTDAGFSDVAFSFMPGDPAAARASAIAELENFGENDTHKNLAGAFSTFLEKSGKTFRLSFAPQQALSLRALENLALTAPEKLGMTVSVTPAP